MAKHAPPFRPSRRRIAGAMALAAAAFLAPVGASAAEPPCEYEVTIRDRRATELHIAIACPGAATVALVPARGYFNRYASRLDGHVGWVAETENGAARARYRFDLDRLAADFDSIEHAKRHGGSVVVLPASFLPRPADPERMIALRFVALEESAAASGLRRDGAGRHILSGRDLFYAGYMAFGRLRRETHAMPPPPYADRAVASSSLHVVTLDGALEMGETPLSRWVLDSAKLVADYWGGFPAEEALLILAPMQNHAGVAFGRVIGAGGITAIVQVGEGANRDRLYGDWILIHELLHVGGPFVYDGGHWLMEGMATYIEPIIRARAGWQPSQEVWAEFARGMPRGLAPMRELGLSQVRGRGVYWSGALFMLMADIELRRLSAGRVTLDDCLRGVLKAGGNATRRWTVAATIRACDEATGMNVVSELAARHVHAANGVDLDALWRDLGIDSDGKTASYRDDAPLAWIRKAIVPD